MNDVVYRIRKKDSRAKQLVVHFNRLKPYLQPVIGDSTEGKTNSEERKEDTPSEEDEIEDMFIVSEPTTPAKF